MICEDLTGGIWKSYEEKSKGIDLLCLLGPVPCVSIFCSVPLLLCSYEVLALPSVGSSKVRLEEKMLDNHE